jgi:hypothetical protein
MGTRDRVFLAFAIALLVAVFVAPAARAEGLHRTAIGFLCVASGNEGADFVDSCEATVADGSPDPTPPTGTVTVQHTITCTLGPISAADSVCDFSLTVPPTGEFKLSSEYSGDSTHARSELGAQWEPAFVGAGLRIDPTFVPLAYLPAPSKPESKATGSGAAPQQAVPKAHRPRLLARPSKRTRLSLARFRFGGGGSFECRLDGTPYRPCGAVFRHRVATGVHVLRVRVGSGDPVATYHWRVLAPQRPR